MTNQKHPQVPEEQDSALPSLAKQTSFPFMRLPIELRIMIWHLYCLDLRRKGRLLHFCGTARETSIRGDTALWSETQRLRSVMAVHTESRQLGKHAFPKELHFGNKDKPSAVRINPAWDLAFAPMTLDSIDGLQEVENICIDVCNMCPPQVLKKYLEGLLELKRVFLLQWLLTPPQDKISHWISSKRILARSYGGEINQTYIWPNVVDDPEFAKQLAEEVEMEWNATPDMNLTYWPLFCTSMFCIEDIPVPAIGPSD